MLRYRPMMSSACPDTHIPTSSESAAIRARRIYLGLRFAAVAACLNSLFACSSSSFAFAAWPFISHSLACCAAVTFWKACSERRCAAARFGCLFGLTFCAGFYASSTPPQSRAGPRRQLRTTRSFVIMHSLSELISAPRNGPNITVRSAIRHPFSAKLLCNPILTEVRSPYLPCYP